MLDVSADPGLQGPRDRRRARRAARQQHGERRQRSRGLVYALNQQREWLGDAATPTREIVRIDQGAHVVGGVAADGKSAQVGIYPPTDPGRRRVLGLGCLLGDLLNSTLGFLSGYNPAIRADVSVMDEVKIYDATTVVPGTYRDVAGEAR